MPFLEVVCRVKGGSEIMDAKLRVAVENRTSLNLELDDAIGEGALNPDVLTFRGEVASDILRDDLKPSTLTYKTTADEWATLESNNYEVVTVRLT